MSAEQAAGASGASPAEPLEAAVGGRLAVLAQARAENFPVASRLLPGRLRHQLMAVYGYARLVDDIGDEAPGDRAALLDLVSADLDRLYSGRAARVPTVAALSPLVHTGLPRQPLDDLLAANRMDQERSRYPSYADLVDYCRLSANPVGRMVLHIAGASTGWREARSDEVCTALQIVEHLQDVAEDYAAGRIYLPLEDLASFGVAETDLAGPSTPEPVRRLVRFEADRAFALLRAGAPLVGSLRGFARVAVAGYVGGGFAALAALRRRDHRVLAGPPKAARSQVLRATLSAYARRG